MRASQQPTVLSTFTGAGGLDIGLERAGCRILACIELDPVARQTLQANRPAWPLLEPHNIVEVATRLRPSDLQLDPGELDLIVGGPPCQTFSKAAQWSYNGRAGLCGDCADAIDALLTLVGRFRPKAVLLENVPGFVRGRTDVIPYLKQFFDQLNQLEGTNYQVQYRIENAADFGVPQRRRRAIVVILRTGLRFPWPEPTHANRPVRAWDALRNITPEDPPKLSGKWAELVPSIPEGENYQWHTSRGGGKELFGYRTRFWSFLLKLAKDRPSWTLPAKPGPATGPFHWDNRPLTISESLRLQTFPPGWNVSGAYYEQFRQVGNATPPLLAEVYGRALLQHLIGQTVETDLTLTLDRVDEVPPPSVPRPVPQKYLDLERSHQPHPGPGKGPRPLKSI